MKNTTGRLLLLACGAPLGLAAVAAAQPSLINISGASLLENFVKAPASTNDYIDADGDDIAGVFNNGIDQLAPAVSGGAPFASNLRWIVQYRVTGSVNGFIELARFGSPNLVTTDDSDLSGIVGNRPGAGINGVATTAYVNRTKYIDVGASTGAYNPANPGGAPYRSDSTFNAFATYASPGSPSSGGIRIDISPLDVPSFWAVQKSGTAAWNRLPPDPGYGRNDRLSVNQQGGTSGFAGLDAALPGLNGRNLYDGVPSHANSNTIFDTPLSFAVICPVVNPGTGMQQVSISELRYLYGTGRARNGENLVVVTRDGGSGTRNAFQNCIGMDPSFGVGDNVGGGGNPPAPSTLAVNNNMGSQFVPSNKGASGGVEATLRNSRLSIGYLGGERGVTGSGSASWLTSNALEIPSLLNDTYGGTQYVRPDVNSVINNDANGWVLGGPAVLATIGDPLAEPVALGGTGAATPRIFNRAAAAYVNNIRKSIAEFVSVPNAPENFGMPGEYAATQFTLPGAQHFAHNFVNPAQLDVNPAFNQSLSDYTLANSVYANPRYATPNFNTAGKVPTRTAGVVYSDGVANGQSYITEGGATLTYGTNLPLRNKIAGDFDGNGVRDMNDIPDMLRAFRERNSGPAWAAPSGTGPIAGAPGTDACIEILGDFDCNGSFDRADVRYFADGLSIPTSGPNAGHLDRRAGFETVDNAWFALVGSGNFFGTALANSSKAYAAGDSRGDVIGASGNVARGWAPVGADGMVDARDIDYVYKQFRRNAAVTNGVAAWSNLSHAVTVDLSCDMNGDMVVDQSDVHELVHVILGTNYGDVNLDGVVNAADLAVAQAHLGQAGGWADGDIDGDGMVTAADLAIINAGFNCLADIVGIGGNPPPDGLLTGDDFNAYIAAFASGEASFEGGWSAADIVGIGGNPPPDGLVTGDDFNAFIAGFAAGCP